MLILAIENDKQNVLPRYSCVRMYQIIIKNYQQARLAGYSEDPDSILGKSEYFINS